MTFNVTIILILNLIVIDRDLHIFFISGNDRLVVITAFGNHFHHGLFLCIFLFHRCIISRVLS